MMAYQLLIQREPGDKWEFAAHGATYDGAEACQLEGIIAERGGRTFRLWLDVPARPNEPLEVELAHSGAVAIRIGDYTLSRGEAPGTIGIHHDSGEGGDFPAGDVESAIADYYGRAF